MEVEEIQKKFELNIRNFDYVEYGGSQYWKHKRTFKNFPYTYRDLGITKKQYETLLEIQRTVWLFADTLLLDNAQNNEHVLDYCFHGQRMGWQTGDELWLVFNIAFNRFEIRYPNSKKWDPLDKYIVDENLTIHVKLGYVWFRKNATIKSFLKNKGNVGYIQVLSINSFPDRIELNLTCASNDKHFNGITQIFDYFKDYNQNKQIYGDNVYKIMEQLYNINISEQIKYFKENHNSRKTYNFSQIQQKPEDYWNIFLKYNHQLKFWQNEKDSK